MVVMDLSSGLCNSPGSYYQCYQWATSWIMSNNDTIGLCRSFRLSFVFPVYDISLKAVTSAEDSKLSRSATIQWASSWVSSAYNNKKYETNNNNSIGMLLLFPLLVKGSEKPQQEILSRGDTVAKYCNLNPSTALYTPRRERGRRIPPSSIKNVHLSSHSTRPPSFLITYSTTEFKKWLFFRCLD
ncbi:hypothetical protein CEXT_320621 [Caerostris extrusa]|uniref:Uncharacterized protein n=1 Tax=Caerostris extrusa TaxID=172846 RepID=A0AAV4WJA4_CAEEX|nr:hypothetical protein CEXT_320621 [Caerostris extrusa]